MPSSSTNTELYIILGLTFTTLEVDSFIEASDIDNQCLWWAREGHVKL